MQFHCMKMRYSIEPRHRVYDIENKFNNYNHDKYVATSEFNTLADDVFNARLAQANVIT